MFSSFTAVSLSCNSLSHVLEIFTNEQYTLSRIYHPCADISTLYLLLGTVFLLLLNTKSSLNLYMAIHLRVIRCFYLKKYLSVVIKCYEDSHTWYIIGDCKLWLFGMYRILHTF